jgi:competence protein ComEA
MQTSQRKLVIIAVVVAFVVGLVLVLTRAERSRDLVLNIEPVAPGDDVTVYVGGAVEEPGLYSLPRGSRISEALDLAGLFESSDTSSIDLAATLADEQTIIVPEISAESDADLDQAAGEGDQSGAVINVNHANEDELQLLPGVGPAIAARIIERRESIGPFESLDELSEITGISDRMIDDLRGLAVTES